MALDNYSYSNYTSCLTRSSHLYIYSPNITTDLGRLSYGRLHERAKQRGETACVR